MQDPLIKADQSLPEITIKAVLLGIVLAVVLGAANVYMALKLGHTIAASIPAAVVAMGTLRLFKTYNVLENNIVQTCASAGEGVAAATSFMLPTLIMVGYWQNFRYWDTVLITIIGGLLGVFFSIPLRRILLNYPNLSFPEGTAVGNLLKSSAAKATSLRHLLQGGLAGGLIVLLQSGFKFSSDCLQTWMIHNKILFGMSIGFSPALLGAGFIIGMQACFAFLVGLILGWIIGIPILGLIYGIPQADNVYDMVMILHSDHIRYIGVGTMLIGGVWTLIILFKPIVLGIASSIKTFKAAKIHPQSIPRTERDISMYYAGLCIIVLLIIGYFALLHLLNLKHLNNNWLYYGVTFIALMFILLIGFFVAAICAYLSGLVGMTNNPISGLLLGIALVTALLILASLGYNALKNHQNALAAMGMVLIISTMVAAIIVISGENIQDLKAGQILGATPWKQQVMLMVGVVVSALVVAPVLELLYQGYGIGGIFPRPNMDRSQMLAAPQAGLIAAITQAAFGHSLRLMDMGIGAALGIIAVFADEIAKRFGKNLPVLAIGIGIYLPPDITSAVILGGVINQLSKLVLNRRVVNPELNQEVQQHLEIGILVACGLVAGAAVMGVVIAIPFVLKGSSDALRLAPESFTPIATGIGVVITLLLCWWLYHVTTRKTI
jgi:putative OPT family oligopeptide transporter